MPWVRANGHGRDPPPGRPLVSDGWPGTPGDWDARLLSPIPFPFEDRSGQPRWKAGLDPYFRGRLLVRAGKALQNHHPEPCRGPRAHADHAEHHRGLARGEWGIRGSQTVMLEEPGQRGHGGQLHRPAAPALRREGGGRPGGPTIAGASRMIRWRGLPGYSDQELWGGEDPLCREPGATLKAITLNWSIYTSSTRAGGGGLE